MQYLSDRQIIGQIFIQHSFSFKHYDWFPDNFVRCRGGFIHFKRPVSAMLYLQSLNYPTKFDRFNFYV